VTSGKLCQEEGLSAIRKAVSAAEQSSQAGGRGGYNKMEVVVEGASPTAEIDRSIYECLAIDSY
jgi:hypothetical protein